MENDTLSSLQESESFQKLSPIEQLVELFTFISLIRKEKKAVKRKCSPSGEVGCSRKKMKKKHNE